MSKQKEKPPNCQRCLQKGHWSYECTNPRAYVYRPSATMQYFNPSLRAKISPKNPPNDDDSSNSPSRRSRSRSSKHSSSSSVESSRSNESKEKTYKYNKLQMFLYQNWFFQFIIILLSIT